MPSHRNPALATFATFATFVTFATALPGVAPPQAPVKLGFVYVSPVGDAGWTFQHDQGRREMEAALQGRVTSRCIENVPEGADAERVIRQLAAEGCRLVFTTSFGYMNPTAKVAAAFPNCTFFHATGYKQGRNLGSYNARFYEGRYLNGVIAGRMTKSNLAGYVAAFPIPEVLQGINAFTLGMRRVNPKAEVRVIWVNAWFDPGKEREAALALISQGADVITHHTDSTAVVQAAEAKHREKGVWAFSYHSDMARYGPTAQLSGTTARWGGFYTRTVRDVLTGAWQGTHLWGGFRDGMIQLAPFSRAVPADLRRQVGALQEEIRTGRLHPFAGPVRAQDGQVKVAPGRVLTDSELGAMNYYVQGVGSSLPKR